MVLQGLHSSERSGKNEASWNLRLNCSGCSDFFSRGGTNFKPVCDAADLRSGAVSGAWIICIYSANLSGMRAPRSIIRCTVF
jgi:hypothetical protein